jgi:hypothetical protein
MKIVLDTELCKKEGKDADVILYLLSLLSGCKITTNTFEKARQQRMLKFEQPYDVRKPFPEYVSLTDTAEYAVESLMASSDSSTPSEERLINLAEKLQELFPDGKKPGYAYKWRDSTSCIVDRLNKFFLKYGPILKKKKVDCSDEAIIRATKEYVDSFNGNYTYMQLLKYFIWKNKTTGEEVVRGRVVGEVERQSQLAAYLEDSKDKKVSADWDLVLR